MSQFGPLPEDGSAEIVAMLSAPGLITDLPVASPKAGDPLMFVSVADSVVVADAGEASVNVLGYVYVGLDDDIPGRHLWHLNNGDPDHYHGSILRDTSNEYFIIYGPNAESYYVSNNFPESLLDATFIVGGDGIGAGPAPTVTQGDPVNTLSQTTAGNLNGAFSIAVAPHLAGFATGLPYGFLAYNTETGFEWKLTNPAAPGSAGSWQAVFESNVFGYVATDFNVTTDGGGGAPITGLSGNVQEGAFYSVSVVIARPDGESTSVTILNSGDAVFVGVMRKSIMIAAAPPAAFDPVADFNGVIATNQTLTFTGIIKVTTGGSIIINGVTSDGFSPTTINANSTFTLTPIGVA